jgi:hypothetical protein
MNDDDRRLADRLSRYESRVPVSGAPVEVRPRRVPWAAVSGVAAVVILAVVLGSNLLRDEPAVGNASPTPSVSPGESLAPSAAERQATRITAVTLEDGGRILLVQFTGNDGCLDYGADVTRTADVLEVTVYGTPRVYPSAHPCGMNLEYLTLEVELDPPFTGSEVRDGFTGETFSVAVASATATPAPTTPVTPEPTTSPDPAFATPQIVMRNGTPETLQYVVGFGTTADGRIAAVSIADYPDIPATAPRPGRSAIYAEAADGTWEPIDTGTTFEGVDLVELFSPAGGPMVAYGVAADNARPEMTGVWTSTDGRSWTEVDAIWLGLARYSGADIAGGARGYVQAGTTDDGIQVYWSPDALTWELVHEMSGEGAYVRSAGAGPEGFVIVGTDGATPVSLASGDGRTWFTSLPQASVAASDILMKVAPIGSDWVAAGWRDEESEGIELWWSADGLTWASTDSLLPAEDMEPFGSRVMYPGHLVSAGDRLFLSAAWAVEGTETRPLWVWISADGRAWELLELGDSAEVRAISDAGCCLALGGRIGRNTGEAIIWRWDPVPR